MSKVFLYNEDCVATMHNRLIANNYRVDLVLTSPPYNTGRISTSQTRRDYYDCRYDIHLDNKSPDEYCLWCVDLFNLFDKCLKKDGCILWNVSYGNDATENTNGLGVMWLSIADIIRNTSFTVADRIIWKKKSALPNNSSSNRLTRIVEDIFVFCRKDELKTFKANKAVKSVSKTGQKYYENIMNYIEAPNNDGKCGLNKATYSSELCRKLLNIYAVENAIVYDPFMGTGTTAVACKQLGINCIGSELSENQVKWALDRLEEVQENSYV